MTKDSHWTPELNLRVRDIRRKGSIQSISDLASTIREVLVDESATTIPLNEWIELAEFLADPYKGLSHRIQRLRKRGAPLTLFRADVRDLPLVGEQTLTGERRRIPRWDLDALKACLDKLVKIQSEAELDKIRHVMGKGSDRFIVGNRIFSIHALQPSEAMQRDQTTELKSSVYSEDMDRWYYGRARY